MFVGRGLEKRAGGLEEPDVGDCIDLEDVAQFLEIYVLDVGQGIHRVDGCVCDDEIEALDSCRL